MRIDNASAGVKAYTETKQNAKTAALTKEGEEKVTTPRTDSIEISKTPTKSETVDTNKASSKTDEKVVFDLIAESEKRTSQFQQMIRTMLSKQGEQHNLVLQGQKLNVTSANSAKAQQAIAPGGEYSVEKVAGRIMDMAKALSGGDASKIAMLKDAVRKGFGEAGAALGQELPQISKDTYDEVMKQFDDWEKGDN